MTDPQDIATTDKVASTGKRAYSAPHLRSKNRQPRKIKLKAKRPRGRHGY